MNLDPQKTAMLTLDFQAGIIAMIPGSEAALAAAGRAVQFARGRGMRVIHIGVAFREGHPEIPASNARFAAVKEKNLLVRGSPSAEIHPSLIRAGEWVIYKQRVSAFSENDLHLILRAQGIENLVFFGLATSGVTLSTLRRAADLDYRCTVLKDACWDHDPEVHRVLTDKVFAMQATVLTVDEFIAKAAPAAAPTRG